MAKATDTQVGGSHYKTMAIEPAEYCEKNKLTMLESGIVKYVSRHRSKGGIEDIRKAAHCLELLIQFQYPEEK